MQKKTVLIAFASVAYLFLSACTTRPKLKGPETAMRELKEAPLLLDDMDFDPLVEGIEQNIAKLEAQIKIDPGKTMQFGQRQILASDYVTSLEHLAEILVTMHREEALKKVREEFSFFEIYGDTKWGEVFLTSYYDPVMKGSKTKTEKFTTPLYAMPDDMVTVRYSKFLETFPRLRNQGKAPHEQKSVGSVLRGRLVVKPDGKKEIVPFFSREEIDGKKSLEGRGLEIAWVDPIDSFFIQIQGSGVVEFDDGSRIRVGYAAQNGHKYVAIGKFLTDVIPIEKMSMQAIRKHLQTLPDEKKQEIFNKNPSYVFFQRLESKSLTFFGTEVVKGRTIATDYRYFPKGAVAFLEFNEPVFGENDLEPIDWKPTSRLVLDQDTGGAIRGAHRLDLYWGEGWEAARSAGVMRHHGKLYYLAPKAALMSRLGIVPVRHL